MFTGGIFKENLIMYACMFMCVDMIANVRFQLTNSTNNIAVGSNMFVIFICVIIKLHFMLFLVT